MFATIVLFMSLQSGLRIQTIPFINVKDQTALIALISFWSSTSVT